MRLLRCADSGLLIEVDDVAEVRALHQALTNERPHGVVDFVPAPRTLLLLLDPRLADIAEVEQAVLSVRPCTEDSDSAPEVVRVPVVYDGADLAAVAKLTGLTENEVVAAHTSSEWTVGFDGFAPGFGYLSGGPEALTVPRRSEPRTRIPAGAVGLAGEYSGIYPRDSAGGWQLIGHTEMEIWHADHNPPALLRPGVRVRFQEAA
ncbi:allophanate hydrolase [Prauserella marina]|uniref:Sensor histidine kinase inhibitor, KipI family n=1 Tax=Prauserella marina TaxID=530584 RepID=A0A222VIQ5_9PSEU|nr:5-oxoprolinase subunit PxpB [Prauserella marina]ASR33800.1 allophanate hydrolase [Prauserella marina]PWV82379.1 KipI family sensor histidine kinase inhibitor [Prauserella marina]SDC67739.1 sensor histidine kinase inhibitor, KipI family [Prauserella marina]